MAQFCRPSRRRKRFPTEACQSCSGDQLPGSALAVDPAGVAAPDGSIDHCGGDAGSGERTRGCFSILAREGLGRAENEPGQFLITPQRHAC